MLCEFSSKCSEKCSSYIMCSLLHTEEHINLLEKRLTEIFENINDIIVFSSESGKTLLRMEDNLPTKEDIIEQFNFVYDEINSVKNLIIEGNKEIKELIFSYSNEVKMLNQRIEKIEKVILPEEGNDSNV